MFTHKYNGMYINGYIGVAQCYVTDDFNTFSGKVFRSYRAAKLAITKARNKGVPESR